MTKAPDLVSPKQVARAIGVSESSMKRWCDQGLIRTVRTAGGHRKMAVAEVLRYLRDHDQKLISPEILGLPPVSPKASSGLSHGGPRLANALLSGDELLARQIVFDLLLAKHAPSAIFDEVVAAAFREIGSRWECREADVYQERRGCEIALRILFELRRMQQTPDQKHRAIGGTIEGDQYALPSAMAEVVLRDCNFQATALGTSIPVASLVKAVEELRPTIFWLSVSHIREDPDFIGEFTALSQACAAAGTALVVGGRALTDNLRRRMTYSAYSDNMQHLEAFARTLQRTLNRGGKTRGSAKSRRAPRKSGKSS